MTANNQTNKMTSLALTRAMKLNIWAGSMGSAFLIIFSINYLSLYAKNLLQLPNWSIGVIASIPLLFYVLQIKSALLVDKIGSRKKYWVIIAMIHRSVWILLALCPFFFKPFTQSIVLFFVLIISAIFSSLAVSPWYSWMGDLVPENIRGKFFGKRMAINQAVVIATLIIVAIVLEVFSSQDTLHIGFGILFVIGTIVGCMDIIIHSFIPEPTLNTEETPRVMEKILAPVRDKHFLKFIIAFGLWSFASAMVAPFIPLFLKNDLNLPYWFFNVLLIIPILMAIISAKSWGVLADKFGHKPILVICLLGAQIQVLLYFLATIANAYYILSIGYIIGGLFTTGFTLSFFNMMLELPSSEKRMMYVAVFWAIVGMIAFLSPFIAGVIMDSTESFTWELPFVILKNYHIIFLVYLAVIAVCVPFFIRIQGVKSKGTTYVLGTILSPNLIRTLSNLSIVTAPYHKPHKKLKAIVKLGKMKKSLAIDELIESLNDPILSVRKQAALSLGRIGSPEATDILIEKLDDIDADIKSVCAIALGMIGDTKATSPLIATLLDPNPEVRAAAARGLGSIRDPKAKLPLLEVMVTDPDPSVYAACIEAFENMGEIELLIDTLTRIQWKQRPLLKRRVALAIGNLISRQDDFYSVLLKESHVPGSTLSKLAAKIVKHLRMYLRKSPNLQKQLEENLRGLTGAIENEEKQQALEALIRVFLEVTDILKDLKENAPESYNRLLTKSRFALFQKYVTGLANRKDQEDYLSMDEVLLGVYFLASTDLMMTEKE